MGKIVIDEERLTEVAEAALRMLEQRVPPFHQENIFPDAIIPEGVEPKFLLFYGCALDSMRKATEVYKTIRDLAKMHDLSRLHEVSENDLKLVLEAHFGPGIENAVGKPLKTLMENAKKLSKYNGDPANLKADTVDETIDLITSFDQFGSEKAALLMKNFVRFGIWDFPEHTIPIKVDRHVKRICLGAGVIKDYSAVLIKNPKRLTGKSLNEAVTTLIEEGYFTRAEYESGKIPILRGDRLERPLSDSFRRYTIRTGKSAVKLDDALWAIGAEGCDNLNYCTRYCGIYCEIRPASDNGATYFFPTINKRDKDKLFARLVYHRQA